MNLELPGTDVLDDRLVTLEYRPANANPTAEPRHMRMCLCPVHSCGDAQWTGQGRVHGAPSSYSPAVVEG